MQFNARIHIYCSRNYARGADKFAFKELKLHRHHHNPWPLGSDGFGIFREWGTCDDISECMHDIYAGNLWDGMGWDACHCRGEWCFDGV